MIDLRPAWQYAEYHVPGAGNVPPLDTLYNLPTADDLTLPALVPLWVVQRDERLGVAVYESCIRVVP